jgi:hypothetical protein
MVEEKKPEEHKEEKQEEIKKEGHRIKLPFKIKITKTDIAAMIALIVLLALVAVPTYSSKDNCEIARPGYKCASIKDVMIENCNYWGKYSCKTNADASLPQIEWYIGNLCTMQNQYHSTGLDCSNLKSACNTITGNQICPLGQLNQ